MFYIVIFILTGFILNGYVSAKGAGIGSTITCGYGPGKVTGYGDACCMVSATGTFSSEVPYNSKTQLCCRGNTIYSGGLTLYSSKVQNGTACCLEEGYDDKTQRCCTAYEESIKLWKYGSVGYGDSCCGPKVYNRTTHGCCHTFVVGRTLYSTYDLGNTCCIGGVVFNDKRCSSQSNNKENSASLKNSKSVYLTFTISLLFKVWSFLLF
jgi:hypothetical protein